MTFTRHTQPLREDFTSALDLEYAEGFTYLQVIQRVWLKAYKYEQEAWQVDLLRRMTELHNGHLRYRQVLISMGRQNGKTELAAALALWRLLLGQDSWIIGIASSREQADFVYDRTRIAIDRTGWLQDEFKATGTRGTKGINGARYNVKPAKDAALQGIPVALGIVDEVHLLKMELWTALVNGTGARPDTLIVGITTAGDESSVLLKHLYELGDKAIAGEVQGFGFFLWEAPEGSIPDSDEQLAQFLIAANPALASGRVDMATTIQEFKTLPPDQAIRYRLNRFVSGSDQSFVTGAMWAQNARSVDESFPEGHVYFTIDADADMRYATITRTIKSEGFYYTELVASIPQPTPELLEKLCRWLYRYKPLAYVIDASPALKGLAERLKSTGYPVKTLNGGDVLGASALFYAKLAQRKVKHGSDPLMSFQIPNTIRKTVGDSFKIFRKDKSVTIDAVRATAFGIYAVENYNLTRPTIH